MIKSLRWRFFVVVWLLLVAGLVGVGTLLGRWSTTEISRVSAEARVDRMLGRSEVRLLETLGANPDADSATIAALLTGVVADDSLLLGAAVIDRNGRIVAGAMPPMAPREFAARANGGFEWSRDQQSDGRRTAIRMLGQGQRINPRNSADPRYLVLLPTIHTQLSDGEPTVSRSVVLMSRLRWALVIGSILAALVTLAVSGPLLGRVGALTGATTRLREGDLSARVDVKGKDELADLGRSFNAMAEDLERSEAQRRQMIVDVAHELRTPLTNLTGILEAVQDRLRPADEETLAVLHEEAGLLGQLVGDLQDLSLADAGELRVAVEPIDAADVARRAVAGFASSHAIVLELPDGPVLAQANEWRLGQVLRNLIQNAVTHSPEAGSVVVEVVTLRSRSDRRGGTLPEDSAPSGPAGPQDDNRTVTIVIEDHGPGIAPADLPRIWDRFYRADASRSRATGGMGLGLPVARRLVEAMGGEVAVESEVGRGSRFIVRLG